MFIPVHSSTVLEWISIFFGITGPRKAWPDRSAHPVITAISPVGWLPPLCRVAVAWDGRRYRIIRWPIVLHGVSSGGITAAAWVAGYTSDCEAMSLGSGSVQIWRKDGSSYKPQEYEGGGPVAMIWKNTADAAVAATKFLTAEVNADNDWIVDIEPCNGKCPPAE